MRTSLPGSTGRPSNENQSRRRPCARLDHPQRPSCHVRHPDALRPRPAVPRARSTDTGSCCRLCALRLLVELHMRATSHFKTFQVAGHGLRTCLKVLRMRLHLRQRLHGLFGSFNALEDHAQFSVVVQLMRGFRLQNRQYLEQGTRFVADLDAHLDFGETTRTGGQPIFCQVSCTCSLASCTFPLASCLVLSAARPAALFCFALSGLLTRCTTSAVPDETVVFIGNCLPLGRVSISNVTSYL